MIPVGDVLIDGQPVDAASASVSVFDIGFQRGYGCFEAMRAYGGRVFRLTEHLDRLQRSAGRLHVALPERTELESWCSTAASGECVVRVFVTGGIDPATPGTGSHVIVYAEPVPAMPTSLRVQSRVAPWHTDGYPAELTGAKILSYGYNLAAGLAASRRGFDDALLIGRTGRVLEGPTFSVGWIAGDVLFTPDLELGILDSITRRAVMGLAGGIGVPVETGSYQLSELLAAEEVFVLSTVREVQPVGAVDDHVFVPGPLTERLATVFAELVATET